MAYANKARVLINKESYFDAKQCCDTAIKYDARNYVAYNNKGLASLYSND